MLSDILQNMPCMSASQTFFVHTDFVALKLMSNEVNILVLIHRGRGNMAANLHFADNILKWIFLNENIRILMKLSLKFVPNVPINNKPALVQIISWVPE